MNNKSTFPNIEDELRWYAVVMSEGNIEAVSQFVEGRNELRELKSKKSKAQEPKERNVWKS